MIQARVIADSLSPAGARLTTVEVVCHRFILAELNKHRVFSNSASSSRAIPFARVLAMVNSTPALPVEWGRNQRGMQARELLSPEAAVEAEEIWLEARDAAVVHAQRLADLGVHRQIVNRLLEPFAWQTVVLSSTYWDNFFALRAHPDAQPEFRDLAFEIQQVYRSSTPVFVDYGAWHLPYVTPEERRDYDIDTQRRLSVARCARTSYLNQNQVNVERDLELFQTLVSSDPMHSVPLEMVGTPASPYDGVVPGNYCGWHQWRHVWERDNKYLSLR